MKHLLCAIALMLSFSATANWQLDNEQSQLSFISIKKNDIAEVHHFNELSGQITAAGDAKVTINLMSVDTAIPIRDERMQSLLFITDAFPSAQFSVDLEKSTIENLAIGASKSLQLSGELNLHGETKTLAITTLVTKLTDKKLLVVSLQPVIINAKDFTLGKGVLALQQVAELPIISNAVPVSFVLTFTR